MFALLRFEFKRSSLGYIKFEIELFFVFSYSAVYAFTSIDSHTLILSNIVTAAFLGKTKEFELILDFILSGVSSQEFDPSGLT